VRVATAPIQFKPSITGDQYEVHAANLVESGKMPLATLDKAAGAILKVKARLGLIPVAFDAKPESALVDTTLVQTNLGDNPMHVAAVRPTNTVFCHILIVFYDENTCVTRMGSVAKTGPGHTNMQGQC
jgi:hypothetical protein